MRLGGNAAFRYTRIFGEKISAFVELRDSYMSLLKVPEYLDGRGRNAFTISLGCSF